MNIYDIGDLVRIKATFENVDGVILDPTTITFKLKTPDDVTTVYVYGTDAALVKESTGVYHVDWSCTQAGLHIYLYIGTGTVQTAEESHFQVRERAI